MQTKKNLRKQGYSLIEVVIALAIAMVTIGGVMSFYIQFYKVSFIHEQKNQINRDMRQLTGELTKAGRQANDHFIYKSIATEDRDTANDRQLTDSSGDFLLFTYKENSTESEISKIVGYFRESTADEELGPVRRFEREFSPASDLPMEELIPAPEDLKDSPTVIELSKGLTDGRLFYNYLGRSIIVNGQIYHGNAAKRVTETYNFTISPRG